VALNAEWRALSRCGGRVANAGYILRNEMYRLVREKKLSFGHYPRCSGHVCRLYRLSMDELAAFSAGYLPMTS
jgi:hypothetical protein